jgi:hypothetical protein
MSLSNRLKLSLAGTAAVALASLPFAVSPASAAKVTEGATSSIEVLEASSNFSLYNLNSQSASTGLVARGGQNGGGRGHARGGLQGFLKHLLELLGFSTTQLLDGTNFDGNSGL